MPKHVQFCLCNFQFVYSNNVAQVFYGIYILFSGVLVWFLFRIIVPIGHVWWKQTLLFLFCPLSMWIVSLLWNFYVLQIPFGSAERALMRFRSITIPASLPVAIIPSIIFLLIYCILADAWENRQRANMKKQFEEQVVDKQILTVLDTKSNFVKIYLLFVPFSGGIVIVYFFCQVFTYLFDMYSRFAQRIVFTLTFFLAIRIFKAILTTLGAVIDSYMNDKV